MMNPHLFTHLFHEGVIVSTRKYVYDAGSNEDAIKGLMQAQHKAVMKDLKKGVFDEKIDQYLGGTPGLEPRAGADPAAAPVPRGERAKTELTPEAPEITAASSGEIAAAANVLVDAKPSLEIINEDLSEPIELPVKQRAESADRTVPIELPMKSAEPEAQDPPPVRGRVSTAQKVSRSSGTPPAGTQRVGQGMPTTARPTPGGTPRPAVIDITEEEISSRLRSPRDTAVEALPADIDSTTPVRTGPNAATMQGPGKPPARPGMVPPVVTRPAPDAPRRRGDSEAVEIYQPAPPSVEPPPGERSERAGTYSVTRKSGDAPIREKTGRIAAVDARALGLEPQGNKTQPIPSGLARPGTQGGGARTSDTGANRAVPPQASREPSARVPQNVPREPTPGNRATPPPPPHQRGGTPAPVPPRVTAPIQNRAASPANPAPNSGVVMTRPAVIVGQPPKQPTQPPTTQRVRKAREDEGRGFGQGLISEKSLDEVILAYLSEDAEDK
jgi:hypothetical protein